jgi:hypothetical protein
MVMTNSTDGGEAGDIRILAVENAESHVKIRIWDPDFPQFAEKPTVIFGVAAVYFCDNRCFQKESQNFKFYQDLES